MKLKYFLFAIMAFVAVSCGNSDESKIEYHIKSVYKGDINNLKIISISEKEKRFCPINHFKHIISLSEIAHSEMIDLRAKAWENKDINETISMLEKASRNRDLKEARDSMAWLDVSYKLLMKSNTKQPLFDASICEYELNNKIKKELFYFDKNGEILTSEIDLNYMFDYCVEVFNEASKYETKCAIEAIDLKYR